MRRSIWAPVGVTILLLVASATLPHADLRRWGIALPVGARGTLTPPAPSRVTRTSEPRLGLGPLAAFAPSWPVPALRTLFARPEQVRASVHTEAGPLYAARRAAAGQSLAHWCLAILLGFAAATAPLAVASRVMAGRAFALNRVVALADRGLSTVRIARRAGLPRDAVRSMLLSPPPRAARKRV